MSTQFILSVITPPSLERTMNPYCEYESRVFDSANEAIKVAKNEARRKKSYQTVVVDEIGGDTVKVLFCASGEFSD